MILYAHKSFCRVICALMGSIFFRRDLMIAGLFVAGATAALQMLIEVDEAWAPKLPHHYGMHALGTVVGFAVVFRTSNSWHRYWEGITSLTAMYSKWEDAYAQLLAFSTVSIAHYRAEGTPAASTKCDRAIKHCEGAMNMFSLMSAFAADRLLHGDIERMGRRAEVASWNKQIVTRRDLRLGEDLTGALKVPQLEVIAKDNRRGTFCNDWSGETYLVNEQPPAELLKVLEKSRDRTSVVMYWITHDLAAAAEDIRLPPPIQSRMYQELSNGMLGYHQALKLADVPFPFPLAQLLTLLLIAFCAFVPIYVMCFTQSLIAGPIVSFLLFEGMWGMNEIAKELESPFGKGANHIPLEDFHSRFLDSTAEMHEAHLAKIQATSGTQGGSPSCSPTPSPSPTAHSRRRPSLTSVVVQQEAITSAGPSNSSLEELVHKKQGVQQSSISAHQALDLTLSGGQWQPLSPESEPPDLHVPRSSASGRALGSGKGCAALVEDGARPAPGTLQLPQAHCEATPWHEKSPEQLAKDMNSKLEALNHRMEQHLARIAMSTEALARAAVSASEARMPRSGGNTGGKPRRVDGQHFSF